jgi:hypothetical protein
VIQKSLPERAKRGNVAKVSVADVRVEDEIKRMDFTKWLDRTGVSPQEADLDGSDSILGMLVKASKVERPQLSTSRLDYSNRSRSGAHWVRGFNTC